MTQLLKENQVDVWVVPLAGLNDAIRSACECHLSGEEQSLLGQYIAQSARDQYLVARALVRRVFAYYSSVDEQSWAFRKNRYGRPYVDEPADFRNVHFNISHTKGLVSLAISESYDVGIDVENRTRSVNVYSIASSNFAPQEIGFLTRGSVQGAYETFLSIWTLKESYVKARGMGLSIPLDSFWFDITGPVPFLHCTHRCADDPMRWKFYQYLPTPDHKMALAVHGMSRPDPRVTFRQIELRDLATEGVEKLLLTH